MLSVGNASILQIYINNKYNKKFILRQMNFRLKKIENILTHDLNDF